MADFPTARSQRADTSPTLIAQLWAALALLFRPVLATEATSITKLSDGEVSVIHRAADIRRRNSCCKQPSGKLIEVVGESGTLASVSDGTTAVSDPTALPFPGATVSNPVGRTGEVTVSGASEDGVGCDASPVSLMTYLLEKANLAVDVHRCDRRVEGRLKAE